MLCMKDALGQLAQIMGMFAPNQQKNAHIEQCFRAPPLYHMAYENV